MLLIYFITLILYFYKKKKKEKVSDSALMVYFGIPGNGKVDLKENLTYWKMGTENFSEFSLIETWDKSD